MSIIRKKSKKLLYSLIFAESISKLLYDLYGETLFVLKTFQEKSYRI